MMTETETYTFVDRAGSNYYVKDVPGAGDCALLALMLNPNLNAPCGSPDELRRLIVNNVRGTNRATCCQIYTIVGDRTNYPFEVYLDYVLRPRFWVGTTFFLWTTIALGVKIRSHFFNEFREPVMECTGIFLEQHFPSISQEGWKTVDVYFHQYGAMYRCKPSMYNHFAALLPNANTTKGELPCLNELANQEGQPWWKKTEEVSRYDISNKQPKPRYQKKNMTKDERKDYNKALTYHYLKCQESGDEVAQMMEKRLEKSFGDMDDTKDIKFNSASADLPILAEKVASVASYSSKQEHRTWLQRSHIIFLHLHPRIGRKCIATTSDLTGVNSHTLVGWLHQKSMIKMWVDLVEDMTAGTAMKALPEHIRDTYFDIDPESKVLATRYRNRIKYATNPLNVYYKGGSKVSSLKRTIFPHIWNC